MNVSFSRIEFANALLAHEVPPIHPENGEFFSPWHQVVMRGCAEDIDLMMRLGAKVDERDGQGDRVMKYCIWGSNVLAFERLVDFMPANWIGEVDSRGRTPLHMALEFTSPRVADILPRLLRAGADVYARDHEGNLPEDIAKDIDQRAAHVRVWKTGTCRNFEAYLQALRDFGHCPEVDEEGDIFWSSRSTMSSRNSPS